MPFDNKCSPHQFWQTKWCQNAKARGSLRQCKFVLTWKRTQDLAACSLMGFQERNLYFVPEFPASHVWLQRIYPICIPAIFPYHLHISIMPTNYPHKTVFSTIYVLSKDFKGFRFWDSQRAGSDWPSRIKQPPSVATSAFMCTYKVWYRTILLLHV